MVLRNMSSGNQTILPWDWVFNPTQGNTHFAGKKDAKETSIPHKSPNNAYFYRNNSLYRDKSCIVMYLFGSPWRGPPAGFGNLPTGWQFGHRVVLPLSGGWGRGGRRGWWTDSHSHVLCAGEAQTAQVLICLTVHHQQPGFILYCLDPLHHLRTKKAAQNQWKCQKQPLSNKKLEISHLSWRPVFSVNRMKDLD